MSKSSTFTYFSGRFQSVSKIRPQSLINCHWSKYLSVKCKSSFFSSIRLEGATFKHSVVTFICVPHATIPAGQSLLMGDHPNSANTYFQFIQCACSLFIRVVICAPIGLATLFLGDYDTKTPKCSKKYTTSLCFELVLDDQLWFYYNEMNMCSFFITPIGKIPKL